MKKRLFALVTAMTMMLGMVGCGNDTTPDAGTTTPTTPDSSTTTPSTPDTSKPSSKSETIKIICGYGVGGTADLVARKFAVVANRLLTSLI